MLFFKRILKAPENPPGENPEPELPRVERRSTQRFAIQPEFPLKAVISLVGRDDSGAQMSASRHGWHWKGRLIDCSEKGIRIQMGPALRAVSGDACELMLSVEGFELTIPCRIANVHEKEQGLVFGLNHAIDNEADLIAYRQLLEIVALGATLKAQFKHTKPDETGYLLEQFAGDRPSRLSVWRNPSDGSVMAFEFLLKDSLVRAAAAQPAEYFTSEGGAGTQPAAAAKAAEIHRLFQWVVPNLAPAVPADVREFLQYYAG